MRTEEELLEELAELEHEQWSCWVCEVIATEDNLSPERLARWEKYSKIQYRCLSEKEKEADRFWAKAVLRVLNDKGEK